MSASRGLPRVARKCAVCGRPSQDAVACEGSGVPGGEVHYFCPNCGILSRARHACLACVQKLDLGGRRESTRAYLRQRTLRKLGGPLPCVTSIVLVFISGLFLQDPGSYPIFLVLALASLVAFATYSFGEIYEKLWRKYLVRKWQAESPGPLLFPNSGRVNDSNWTTDQLGEDVDITQFVVQERGSAGGGGGEGSDERGGAHVGFLAKKETSALSRWEMNKREALEKQESADKARVLIQEGMLSIREGRVDEGRAKLLNASFLAENIADISLLKLVQDLLDSVEAEEEDGKGT
ncbi:MAG: hypothetical protein ACTSU5_13405 [Promethearchaeota archaeon]